MQKEELHVQKGDAYFGVAWYCARKIVPLPFRSDLHWRGVLDDLKQEVKLAAFESREAGEDIKAASNRAQRAIYRFLVSYGWKRPKFSPRYVPEFEPLPVSIPSNIERAREEIRAYVESRFGAETWDQVWSWANSKQHRIPEDIREILEEALP